VGLEQLSRIEAPRPEMIWSTLRHFLADCSGNPHRSELNIEKLHNPFLPGRGCLGLVELRALSMPRTSAIAAARALLVRGLLALLTRADAVPRLVHWGDDLHDRFALPFFLAQDLREVLADLAAAGLGLGETLEDLLLQRETDVLGQTECAGGRLTVSQALEFWPLVGDVASQEGGGSRLVDASTSRLQLRLDAADDVDRVELSVNGHRVRLRAEPTPGGVVGVIGLRFRSFVPWAGLHPALGAEERIVLVLRHAEQAARITLHGWRPNGEAYPGLPRDLEEAAARRRERFVAERLEPHAAAAPTPMPEQARTAYCIDLRRLGRLRS
jgi:uncharacterized protein (DUF2126 family)